MVNEGIMALPQGMPMQGEEPVDDRPVVSSAQSYDAAQTALQNSSPEDYNMLKESMRQNLADVELSPNQLATLLEVMVYMSQRPAEYVQLRQNLIDNGFLDAEDLPEQYDAEFLGAVVSMLSEMQLMQAQGAQEPMTDMPPVQGADAMQGLDGGQPLAMAQGGLADVASYLASQGRNGDSILAHITPEEAQLLKDRGGSGTINPVTGLPEYFKKFFKKIGKAVKKVLQSPVGRILATVALAAVLGPAGVGLSLSTASAAASAGITLAGGGDLKQALIAGATGYFGAGGTIGGVNPAASLGKFLPGAAGSALNTGLSTGIVGAGIGKLGGMSTQDALKMGLTSGASAAALQGLQNMRAGQAVKDADFRSQMQSETTGAAPPTGPAGATGTAQDMLASQSSGTGIQPLSMEPSMSYDPATGSFRANYSMDGQGAGGVNTGLSASSTGIQPNQAFSSADLSRAAGGTGVGTNYSLLPTPATTASAAPTGFIDRMVAGGKDLYNEYLSPSRPGLPGDAGMLRKYGPLAAAGTVAIGAVSGFGEEPAELDEISEAEKARYLASNQRAKERQEFIDRGGYGLERPVLQPYDPIVRTDFSSSIPVGQPGQVLPMGVTASPSGVAQPYNVAGMYGVPLVYGQGAQPQRMAKGGDARPTQFPRKTGPINGPGTGTSDDIPAMLSDGEFVFTAKAVRNAGRGSRRKGAARMYKLMKMLEGGPVKGK
jgi:hypothetical protein